MLDRVLGAAAALSLVLGTAAAPSGPKAKVELTFQDPEIVESSGLVADGDLFVTVNDSGDSGRVFAVARTGRTVGVTSWADEPVDDESLAPAGPGEVWVGDTGDNSRARDSITVRRVPYGVGDREVTPATYQLVYPDRAHDAETLMANPRTGQLFVVSKDIFGGTTYAAPRRLSADHPNELKAVADGFTFATDGSFFPDGKHYVVRGYTNATVYSFPDHEPLASFPLPTQDQGEGISVGPDDQLYLSTEGQFTDVLRMRLPKDVAAAMKPPQPAAAVESEPTPQEQQQPVWPWLVGGGIAFVVGGGWLLLRRGQAS
ncbi:hypothetical protein GCM10009795_047690 [Nocardioides hankookensis]|uniref:WD40 repeat domain-containing protein n=1 Tax=Nocardioides hankookensis TaxID=443157 RepID=A0ABW1LEF4_9ACTN